VSAGAGGSTGGAVRATAHAKLTLALRVLGRRDDGYHDLDALVVSLRDPHDVLEADAGPRSAGVRLEIVGGEPGESVPHDRRNLAVVATEQLLARAGRSADGVRLVLRKQIPAGAGLGGGSADAAAALLVVRRLLDLPIDDDALLAIAAVVGSDVPFCLRGGAAWMRGRGEHVVPVELAASINFLIAIPPFRLATADVYAAWDALGAPRSARAVEPPPGVAHLVADLVNDLEPAAEAVEPRLRRFRVALEGAASRPAVLAGSGPVYAVPLGTAACDLAGLASAVGDRLGARVLWTTSVPRGIGLDG
jgi:4-diphosphocytidyl-2-C-methyl-D-erythritol kinase